MRKILSGLLIICAALTSYAEGHSLRLLLKNGNVETYVLSKKPVVTFEAGDVVIKSDNLTASYARADVESFSFIENTSSIRDVKDREIIYSYDGSVFRCPDSGITVCNLNGIVLTSGKDEVSLSSLPSGIYIVVVNNKSVKITKK